MPYARVDDLPAPVKKALPGSKQRQTFLSAFNAALQQGKSEQEAYRIAYAAARRADGADQARTFSAQQRQRLAKSGAAMSDGSFPIATRQDLLNAISAYGRASNKAAAKRHIVKRARALGLTQLLPDGWSEGSDNAMGTDMLTCADQDCASRRFLTEGALADHAAAVHTHSEVRRALQQALRERFAGPPRQFAWVVDTADDFFIYALEAGENDKLYRQGYSFANGQASVTGNPTEVVRRVVYEPVPTTK